MSCTYIFYDIFTHSPVSGVCYARSMSQYPLPLLRTTRKNYKNIRLLIYAVFFLATKSMRINTSYLCIIWLTRFVLSWHPMNKYTIIFSSGCKWASKWIFLRTCGKFCWASLAYGNHGHSISYSDSFNDSSGIKSTTCSFCHWFNDLDWHHGIVS